MTLCIAAVCRQNRQPRIILLSDRRIETQTAGAEIEFKHRWACMDWPALIAGEVSRADELLSTCHAYFPSASSSPLNRDNIVEEFRKPTQTQKYKLADEYVHATLGFSYKEFLEHGRNWLTDDVFRQTEFEIMRQDLRCEVIAAGFADNSDPCLIIVGSDCLVSSQKHFAAIGTGATIAQSVLFQRRYNCYEPLERALYYVYEAKKLGEIAPGVGQETDITVISPRSDKGKRIGARYVTPDGMKVLEAWFKDFGPRPVADLKPFEELLSTPDEDWPSST